MTIKQTIKLMENLNVCRKRLFDELKADYSISKKEYAIQKINFYDSQIQSLKEFIEVSL